MAERSGTMLRISPEARGMFNSYMAAQGVGPSLLSRRAGMDRHTTRNFTDGKTRFTRPEHVGTLVNALELNEAERLELLAMFGISIPFRFFAMTWDRGRGSVGTHVDQIMLQEGLVDREEQQTFGNILLPRALSLARGIHAFGPQRARELPL